MSALPRPDGCRHASAAPRLCLICRVLRARQHNARRGVRAFMTLVPPRGLRRGERSTIASRLQLVREALDARQEAR